MTIATLLTVFVLAHPPDTLLKPVSILPLPLVYYTPETRLAYGAAATATFRFRRDRHRMQTDTSVRTRPSQITLGMAYTQNKQLLVYLPFQIFYDQDRYYVNGEAGYYRYNYYFYGTGQQKVPRELYGVNFPRIRFNAFRQISPNLKRGKLYGGFRYQYEDYRVTTVEATGLLASGQVPGGRGSRLSGIGTGLFYDSRDRVFFPSKGLVADIAYLHQATYLGGNVRFDRYSADLSSYHSLRPGSILAMNYFVSFTTGVAPFNALSLLGDTKRMRGYYEDRFRDQRAALLQSEVRVDLYRRWGGVVFGAVGVLGDNRSLLRLADPKAAYGVGIRFTVNRRDHLNIRIDYGLGHQSTGLYLTVGEAF